MAKSSYSGSSRSMVPSLCGEGEDCEAGRRMQALPASISRREEAMSELRYTVKAFNTASLSDNKIHDDVVARRFGFAGGLVPGVDVYGYMTHLPVRRWGRLWLERGTAECRFLKPVYDGDIVTVA